MHSFATSLLLLALSFAFAARHVSAADSDSTSTIPSAVFRFNSSSSDGDFVFALNVEKDTGDVYMHMSAPAGNEWMAAGIGSQMKDAVIFVAYPSKNGTGMTLSPRLGLGHQEPSWYNSISCSPIFADDLANANTVTDAVMTVDTVCVNATNITFPLIDLSYTNTAQNFIFAVGPSSGHGFSGHGSTPLQSDSLSAGLRRHSYYGQFTMDMTKAFTTNSSTAGVPRPNDSSNSTNYILENASEAFSNKADSDPAPAIHAFVMCLTFVIIYPLGVLFLRVLKRVILHAVVQTIGLVLTCMATAGGIVISTQYNRSRLLLSAHQIIGILLLLSLFLQLGLGILHHRIFKREQRPTLLGKIHTYLGPTIMAVGVINAPIGFVFAGNPHLCLPYVVILVIVALVFVGLRFFSHKCCGNRGAQKATGPMPAGGPEGYQYPQFGDANAGQAPYQHLGAPPAYGRAESYGSDSIPLQPYESQQSVVGHGVQQTRPMV
ncbi:hypothetical protein LTR36_005653 [Oleoguttula mirabilis]|uniref:Cytochrome b561 domain-containing protein n=1 Tax=Oleoguttula mirabilis TaxID=1507867 RepID=A0AAV9JFK5_9PEZI|nr:hypothetical protein LTR36_005653 [Oleoguttula mirabilis]